MPFASKAQVRACYAANDPAWDCAEFAAATDFSKLPARKAKKSLPAEKSTDEKTGSWTKGLVNWLGGKAPALMTTAARNAALPGAVSGGLGAMHGYSQGGWGQALQEGLTSGAVGAGIGAAGGMAGHANPFLRAAGSAARGYNRGNMAGLGLDTTAATAGYDTNFSGLSGYIGAGLGAGHGLATGLAGRYPGSAAANWLGQASNWAGTGYNDFTRGVSQGAARPFTRMAEWAGERSPGSLWSFGQQAAGPVSGSQMAGRMAGAGALGLGGLSMGAVLGDNYASNVAANAGRAAVDSAVPQIEKALPRWQEAAQKRFSQWADYETMRRLHQLGLMNAEGQMTPLSPIMSQIGRAPEWLQGVLANLLNGNGQTQAT